MSPDLRALRRRLNAAAYALLNEEIVRLDCECERLRAENESLRTQLSWAEDCAERWREDAIEAINAQADLEGGAVGLTQAGQLVVIPTAGAHA
ncbi:hypothetical protein [Paracidovorax anthurii]|uniref:Uncharacterized protein n=1 Tax=Paracidovorax anthurii TaxID=78229 RepID=A0A328ZJK4_9BURK|nr:hypothetical protein [Paracidovorax anthurii]RAR86081.1 hypothetical protein AX018_100242 [Paracidovorax anthurii]